MSSAIGKKAENKLTQLGKRFADSVVPGTGIEILLLVAETVTARTRHSAAPRNLPQLLDFSCRQKKSMKNLPKSCVGVAVDFLGFE
ncbi:MAG: hypothetical protein V7K48_34310 [Nostoc sp.]|uniref:hypothetical protein n=1 Tax=Nostoc sp. TaxID=1180 RepID=UPI002FF45F65